MSGIMDIRGLVASLSEIEKKALEVLTGKEEPLEEVAQKAKLHIDSVRRAASWLAEKGLAKMGETRTKKLTLTQTGQKYLEAGLPEQRLIRTLKEGTGNRLTFEEAKSRAKLDDKEFRAALGSNRKNNFVMVIKDGNGAKLSITPVGEEFFSSQLPQTLAIQQINLEGRCDSKEMAGELVTRGIAREEEVLQKKISISQLGEDAKKLREFSTAQRSYNVRDPVPPIYPGKKQPYIQFLNIIRRKLTELGFREMEAPLIVHEFYNFDVLFQPQNHPARTWTDTYQLKNPTHGKLTDRQKVSAIKTAHETGGVSASSGWGYTWLEEIAAKVMPTAHGTAHSGRQLAKGVKVPGKYFAIARCFRPDVLDATHLIEFNQTDGFIVGEDLNFRHLLGMLGQFAKEIAGAQEVRFLPDYYPFTEPSVQLSAKHPQLGWVELGGAGMFRPEILENLGIKGQAIAWGIGIDRLAMFKLGIKDIRYLFSDDLNWLRKTPLVME